MPGTSEPRTLNTQIIKINADNPETEIIKEAADIIATEPTALQLRFLQTLTEVASEKNSTTIFPVPIDLLSPFIKKADEKENKS